ncbi:metalloprotease 1 protein [Ophiocordyceps camponoti-floridani]|uniref:Metalloprotease 1 protein n=1 Tax=Ophiocordyceps camponoti-floridani TaxID=2030778 RepID=A0A8H4Q8E6_9HYPO|nr:metalloprotease 1 protein [Ophiocordyceps camponoti-floridani]
MLPLMLLASSAGVLAALDVAPLGLQKTPSLFEEPKLADMINVGVEATDPSLFRRGSGPLTNETFEPVNIEVYANIFSSVNSTETLSQEALDNQIRIMNYWFNQFNMFFTLKDTKRIVDDYWARGNDGFNLLIDNHVGTSATLNLHIVEDIEHFNQSVRCSRPEVFKTSRRSDGCMLTLRVIPGAPESAPGYNATRYEGKAILHGLGHWLNLTYTFDGGCHGNDKSVEDVPRSLGSWGCRVGLDSCPNQPGLDPVHNFMSISDESCKHEFTPGQIRRMHQSWHELRAPALAPNPKELPLLEVSRTEKGKLPWYEPVEGDLIKVMTLCVKDRHDQIRETSERRCGSYWYCIFGLYDSSNESFLACDEYLKCLKDRAMPDDVRQEVEHTEAGLAKEKMNVISDGKKG